MSIDAIVLEHPENIILGGDRQTVLKLAPLAIGRGHVIWAKGTLFASNSKVSLEPEAFGARDVAEEITFNEKHGTVTFALAVATTLPGEDDELFVAATLQAFSRPFVRRPRNRPCDYAECQACRLGRRQCLRAAGVAQVARPRRVGPTARNNARAQPRGVDVALLGSLL